MNSQQQTVDFLFARLANFGSYPAGVRCTTQRIVGTAFFPGGSGLWKGRGNRLQPSMMPVGGVMALGHNFDSVAGYQRSLNLGTEAINGPTWGPLVCLLRACDIKPEQCFFTNAYMGLKDDDSGKSTGPFPGRLDADFVSRCRAFLLLQIQTLQPRLLLTLGKEVPPILAPLAPELRSVWSDKLGKVKLQELDRTSSALVYPVWFPDVPHSTAVVALTHPANRGANVGRRRYHDLTGDDWVGDAAEQALLCDALKRIGGLNLG